MYKIENKLIVLFSKNSISSNLRGEAVDIISNKPSWHYVLSKTINLELAPIFYYNLKDLSKNYPDILNIIPEDVVANLKKEYYLNSSRNMFVYKELKNVLNSFKKAEIPVVVLKGAALAELFYHNRGLRSMVDIDLLVRKEHLSLVEEIIKKLGYNPRKDITLSEEYYKEYHHHLVPFMSEDNLIQFEIHHHIVPNSKPLSIDVSRIWERASTVVIAGTKALALSPEDMILHSCLHISFSDTFVGRLRGLCDISEVVYKYKMNLNWDQIINDSMEYGIINYVYYTLWSVTEVLGTEIPNKVIENLKKNTTTTRLEDKILKKLIIRYVFVANQSGNLIPIGFIRLLSKKLIDDTKRAHIFIITLSSFIEAFKNSTNRYYPDSRLRPLYTLFHVFRMLFKFTLIKFHRV